MKNNKLLSAMNKIEDEYIDEALNTEKKRFSAFRITAAAAVCLIALSAAVIVNLNNKSVISQNHGNNTSATNSESANTETKGQKDESSGFVFAGDYSVVSRDSQESSNNQPQMQTSTASPVEEDEGMDMIGFIIKDGKTYMQVFVNNNYTLDKDIGEAGSFKGAYYGLENGNRVYTVKEDDNILIVKLANGGTVILMQKDEGLQDSLGYYSFNGLRVDSSLLAALNSDDGKAYPVYVTRPDSEDMYNYIYNGKTLRQIKDDLDVSWKTEHGKYNPLEKEYQEALNSFLKEKIKTIYDILIKNGINAELINEVRCEATMTKEQFEALAKTGNYKEYAFGFNGVNNYLHEYYE